MRKVVVNSTPLIILCGIGRLDILRMVYQEICEVFRIASDRNLRCTDKSKTDGNH